MELYHVELLSAALFAIGVYGVLARRNAVMVLMAVELMLNAVTINAVAYAAFLDPGRLVGQVITVFVITVAAAEVALGLAIVIAIYRNLETVDIGRVSEMKY